MLGPENSLRAVMNAILYPDVPRLISLCTAGMIINRFAPSPELILISVAAASAEFIGLFKRREDLSRFLYLRKVKPVYERILSDGTIIDPSVTIAEFHVPFIPTISMARQRSKIIRSREIGQSIVEGLINLWERVEQGGFQDYVAFKGTSPIIPSHRAASLGFEVDRPKGLTRAVYKITAPLDRIINFIPMGGRVHEVWMSKQAVVSHLDDFRRELARLQGKAS